MTLDITTSRTATLALPIALAAGVAVIALLTVSGGSPDMAGLRQCDHVAVQTAGAAITQSGKIGARAAAASAAAPATVARMRNSEAPALGADQAVTFARCRPEV